MLTTLSGKERRDGFLVGGGIEWGFAGNWTAKVEYNYIDFGTATVNRAVTYDPSGLVPNPLIRSSDSTLQIVKAGVNYRF